MGKRVAHLVHGSTQDYIEIGDGFALIKTAPPASIVGVPLGDTRTRAEHEVTITALKRPSHPWTYASAETVLHADDTILVAGSTRKAERFSQLR